MDVIAQRPVRAAALDPRRTVHVITDLQSWYVKNLTPERAGKFPELVNNFSRRTRALGIRQAWVAMMPEFRKNLPNPHGPPFPVRNQHPRHPDMYDHALPSRIGLLAYLELGLADVQEADFVYSKRGLNGFGGNPSPKGLVEERCDIGDKEIIAKDLKQEDVDTLVMTGMNADACVPESAVGAAQCGFNVIVITDLLANANDREQDCVPGRNATTVKRAIAAVIRKKTLGKEKEAVRARIKFMSENEFITALEAGAAILTQPPAARTAQPQPA